MIDFKALSQISRTKLFRPPTADDYVGHGELESRLGKGDSQPIILVSAPAGYGKSTLISHWIDISKTPCAWISLDDRDNDLRVFLHYLGASIGSLCRSASRLLEKIIESPDLPPASHIADAFAAEMDQQKEPLVLVFDDYHNIHETKIHELVSALLNHLPACLRIALVSRRRPPLSLGRLRSRNLVLDVRLQDLQFGIETTRTLVEAATHGPVDDITINELQTLTEGWPAGLRMILLALPGKQDIHSFLQQFEGSPWQIQEYLVEEVVNQLPEGIAQSIYQTAILDRFSAELCDAVLSDSDNETSRGQELLKTLRDRGLFCIPLDESGQWHRYHHLFQAMLLRQ